MRFPQSLFLFLLPLFFSCHNQPPVATAALSKPVEVIATVTDARDNSFTVFDLLQMTTTHSQQPEGSHYSFVLNGKTYVQEEFHDDYFVKGEKFLSVMSDSMHPYSNKLLFSDPVFEDDERIILRAGRVLGAWPKGIIYEYEVNGEHFRDELSKEGAEYDINAGLSPGRRILVLVDPLNPARSIAVANEIPGQEDSARYSHQPSSVQQHYSNWLSRGISGDQGSDTTITTAGAYCYRPDTNETAALRPLFRSTQYPFVVMQRKAVQQHQLNLLKSLTVPVHYLHKRKIQFRYPDGHSVFFDLGAYQDCFSIVLFNVVSNPQVRDGYIEHSSYFYKNYFAVQ